MFVFIFFNLNNQKNSFKTYKSDPKNTYLF